MDGKNATQKVPSHFYVLLINGFMFTDKEQAKATPLSPQLSCHRKLKKMGAKVVAITSKHLFFLCLMSFLLFFFFCWSNVNT